jgi:hypothetical protein
MWRRGLACLLVIVIPQWAAAQDGPERLLPPSTQIFFRWDGCDAHRAAYEKTALGKMMQGDTGKFLDALWDWLKDAAEAAAAQSGEPEAPALVKDGLATLTSIVKNGVALSVSANSFSPPQAQLTLVFPKSAEIMIPLAGKIASIANAPVQEAKVGNRSVHSINIQFVNLGWWSEGADAVFVLGTEEPAAYAKHIDAKETGLAQNEMYKEVAAFKEYTVWSRGYVDVAAVAKLGSAISPEVARLVEDLGLTGIKGITFVSGFDGAVERALVEADVPGPRKGLLALMSNKKITLADVPPLPDDVTGFSASNFNVGSIYETGVQVIEAVVRVFAPDQADNIKEGLRQAEGILGVKLGEDLFGSFDDMMVSYNSSSDGLLLGGVSLFKVKDEKKLQGALDNLIKAVPNIPFVPIEIKKRTYQGVDVHTLQINNPGNITAPSIAIHKGWLIYANYPQGAYGFIQRSKGDLPVWKADAKLNKALEAFPKEFTAISVTDPRPAVKFVFSALPPALTLANGFSQMVPNLRPFDIGLIPHAQEATRHLFPNITVTTDDGKKIRSETRASLALPY